MKLRAMLAIGLAGLCLAFAAPASAAAAYPAKMCPTLSISTMTPLVGESITVSGAAFAPNAKIRLELHTKIYVLANVTSSATGTFSTQVKLPAGVRGNHKIFAIGGDLSNTPGCPVDPVQILGIGSTNGANPAGPNGTSGGTAFTGVNIALMLLAAAALIAAGLTFNRRGRRLHTVER